MSVALNETNMGDFADLYTRRRQLIEAKLDMMESLYRAQFITELAEIAERFGWPVGHVQEIHHIRWTEGVRPSGCVIWGEAFAVDSTKDDGGFLLTIGRTGPVSLKVEAQTILTTGEWWRSVADVPKRLQEIVRRSRELRVYELNAQGESINWHPRTVTEVAMVPCLGLRQELGLLEGTVPREEVPDQDLHRYGAKLVSVGITPDGAFVPWAPPASDGDA